MAARDSAPLMPVRAWTATEPIFETLVVTEAIVSLKKPEWSDMDFIRDLWSDPRTMEPVGGPVLLDPDGARSWFEAMVEPGRPTDCYRLVLDGEGRPVGEVSFHRLDEATMTAGLNIKILFSERGRGYARPALRGLLDHFFGSRGGLCMTDDVASTNEGGRRFLLSFGFVEDPSFHDVFRLEMTRERYVWLHPPPDE